MWQYTLLQCLIALIPIGVMQTWLAYPGRVRYGSMVIGAASCVSMLLAMLVSYLWSPFPDSGIDLRGVPYLIGSLYGGIPAASILTVLYMTIRLAESELGVPLLLLCLFFVHFVPYMFFRISTFHRSDRRGKLKIAVRLSLFAMSFIAAQFFYHIAHEQRSIREYLGTSIIYPGLFVLFVALIVYLIEGNMSRLRLQIEYRQMSEKYHYEVRRLQQFIDFSPLVVVFIDRDGNITHLNELALRLLAPLKLEDILNRPYRTSLQAWQCDPMVDAVSRVMGGERMATDLCVIRNRVYYAKVCTWGDAPALQSEGALLIAHDMTELQQLKDELSKMERLSLVGQMAASITHEIRNPMAVIRGFIQLLNERSVGEQQSYYQIILQELDRANSIINDFLSLAQNRIVEKCVSNLHTILEDLMPLLQADANMRGQMIELKLSPHIDPLELNVKEIKQLVLNLARNGMEAMDDKGVLRIETVNLPDTIQLRVVDSGVGIPREKLERLFEPFYTTKASGTGLGLALCLSIVERHNGRIDVESEIGRGTSFIVSFCKPGYQGDRTA